MSYNWHSSCQPSPCRSWFQSGDNHINRHNREQSSIFAIWIYIYVHSSGHSEAASQRCLLCSENLINHISLHYYTFVEMNRLVNSSATRSSCCHSTSVPLDVMLLYLQLVLIKCQTSFIPLLRCICYSKVTNNSQLNYRCLLHKSGNVTKWMIKEPMEHTRQFCQVCIPTSVSAHLGYNKRKEW